MLNFSRSESQENLSEPLEKIKDLTSKIEQKISQKGGDKTDNFIETLSVEELKDLRQVIMASEYLLTKYQDRKDIKKFLEEFIEIIMNSSNSVNMLKGDLEDLVISAEVALKQIQTLHDEVTMNLSLGQGVQTRIEDFGIPLARRQNVPIEIVKEKSPSVDSSANNLTNTARPIHTNDYLTRTAVEI